MFQFAGLAEPCLCIQHGLIQESRDQRLFVNYPRHIADFHAFHRLLMPRHPPCTLNSLTTNIQIPPVSTFAQTEENLLSAFDQCLNKSTNQTIYNPDNDIYL